jgi:hypothetical protein
MANLPVIDLDDSGGGSGGTGKWKFTATNYADLLTKVGMVEGDLAWVYTAQGTWPINKRPEGAYQYISGVWEYGSQSLQDRILETDELKEILAIGNTTEGSDIILSILDKITSANGDVFIDLESNAVAGDYEIDTPLTSCRVTGQAVRIISGVFFGTTYVAGIVATELGSVLSFGKGDFSKFGDITITENDTGDVTTFNAPNYSASLVAQNITIKQNVVNAMVGGKNTILKTDDSITHNKYIFNKGEPFETVLDNTTPTADRVQTLQDKSGTIALLSDISFLSVDMDSAESSVSRVFAGGRTTFTITHNLGTLDLKPEVFRLSDGRTIGFRVERTGINTIEVSRNGNIADGLFRLVI